MRIVFDIEGNGLHNPTEVWVIVCKDLDTDQLTIFRNVTSVPEEKERFITYAKQIDLWVGHNILGYDLPVLNTLLGLPFPVTDNVLDTLVLSKLIDYPRKKHSIESYGEEYGIPKVVDNISFFKYSLELEKRCITDVDIAHKVYLKYLKYISKEEHKDSIRLEHQFQLLCNSLRKNGFAFNIDKANKLIDKVNNELLKLDKEILNAFPPKEVLIKEFTPKATKFGTISKSSVPRVLHPKISDYEIGKTYRHTRMEEFNPSSHKQLINVLNEAGWQPVNKTKTHIEAERELNRLRYARKDNTGLDTAAQKSILESKLENLKVTGWKIDEDNLATLPETAPAPARLLAKRILLESRRRTLTEWLGLVKSDGRIHGEFQGIGAWTHRMAHQHPNTANIPTDAKLYGAEMRALWCAPRNRLLVGCDAEGIQLRIFAHYIDDPEFTKALVEGKKDDQSDPHSLNRRILNAKSRNIAKRFIFAFLLGAGIGKLAQILELTEEETKLALGRLLDRYQGLSYLKETIIPHDAKRGYFIGLDGRLVRIPGDTTGERKHLCMSGYLQNGEAVVMKRAALKFWPQLKDYNAFLVDFVHDEWQTECPNNMEIALKIASIQADSLRQVGEELKLKCPLAGSYWNDDLKDYTIGTNWKVTH